MIWICIANSSVSCSANSQIGNLTLKITGVVGLSAYPFYGSVNKEDAKRPPPAELPPLFGVSRKHNDMKVAVFGAGYVGLVQAAVLAEHGHRVVCVDINQARVDDLSNGIIPIFEPGLSALISACCKTGNLAFTVDAEQAIQSSDVIFIAVGTPPDKDGAADLSYVFTVAKTIGMTMNTYKTVVIKSTVKIGTSARVSAMIQDCLIERGFSADTSNAMLDVVSNPEFLKEGSALVDCQRPDRIILGLRSKHAEDVMRALYAPQNRNHEKIIVMPPESAEMTKYAANCFLAAKISFMNQMSHIAELTGADIDHVRQGIGSDPRIGHHFIYAGAGYGGSCFPKDVSALIQTCEELGIPSGILGSIEDVNHRQKTRLNTHILQHFNGDVTGKVFGVWGLAFKPNTDDMREAPSLEIIEHLLQHGAHIVAYDPESMHEARKVLGDRITYASTMQEAVAHAHALVICTEWKCFRAPDFDELSMQLKDRVIFDGRNLYTPADVEDHGLMYYGIGRGRSVRK